MDGEGYRLAGLDSDDDMTSIHGIVLFSWWDGGGWPFFFSFLLL
jgi:hypothetical protein